MDYGQLAQLARPQMMGDAPSPIHGFMYGQQVGKFNDFLAQAGNQAKLQAMLAEMKANEYMQGAPDRKLESDLSREQNTLKLEDLRKNGRSDIERKRMIADAEAASDFLSQLAKAKTLNEVVEIQRNAAQIGPSTIGGKDIAQLPPDKAKLLADRWWRTKVGTPKHEQDLEKEGVKQTGRVDLARANNASKEKIAIARAEMATRIAQLRAAEKAGKPLTAENLLTKYFEQFVKEGRMSDVEAAQALADLKTAPKAEAVARAETAKGLGAPVVVPESPKLPVKSADPNKPKAVKDLPSTANPKIGDTIDGKKVVRILQNKKTKEYRVELE